MSEKVFSRNGEPEIAEILERFPHLRFWPDVGYVVASLLLKDDNDYQGAVERAFKLCAAFQDKLLAEGKDNADPQGALAKIIQTAYSPVKDWPEGLKHITAQRTCFQGGEIFPAFP
jgi:hypothetical protein